MDTRVPTFGEMVHRQGDRSRSPGAELAAYEILDCPLGRCHATSSSIITLKGDLTGTYLVLCTARAVALASQFF